MEPEPRPVRLAGMDVLPVQGTRSAERPAVRQLAASVATNHTEFTAFYREHRDGVGRALAVTIGDRELAAEAVDEAMARAFQRWSHVSTLDNPAGWVYRVAFNWACSWLRRRKRAPHLPYEPVVGGIGGISEPTVMRALAELDVRQRAVVVCRYILGWSEAETAAALATPVGTVKSRLHRALRTLEARLSHLRPEELP